MADFRKVTERDFRKDEFYHANPEDYEFREDGKVVRKDRWEMGLRSIATKLGVYRDWEIEDIKIAVDELLETVEGDIRTAHRDNIHRSDWA